LDLSGILSQAAGIKMDAGYKERLQPAVQPAKLKQIEPN